MCKNNSLEDYKLSFHKLDVNNWPSIANYDDFGIFISLFDCYSRFGNWLVASVNTLSQPNNTVLLSEVKSHLECVDWASILVDLNDLGVLKILEHLIVDVLS